jgi:hypothetical protein
MDVPAELAEHATALTAFIRPSVALNPADDDGPVPPLATKLGGLPGLPPGVTWPYASDGTPIWMIGQVNLSALAERFPGLLPWPTGGALVQVFTGGVDDTATLVHRELEALRPAVPPPGAEVETEELLIPAASGCSFDHWLDLPAYEALLGQLDEPRRVLAQQWVRRFTPATHQVGGNGDWLQDLGYADAWAADHGVPRFGGLTYSDDSDLLQAAGERDERLTRAEGWQLVIQLDTGWGTRLFVCAPPDEAGLWDLSRLQTVSQCD